MGEKSEHFITTIQKLRAEVERVRQKNDELFRALEPYEEWYANTVKQITKFSKDNDLNFAPKKWNKREQSASSGSKKEPKPRKTRLAQIRQPLEAPAKRRRGRPPKHQTLKLDPEDVVVEIPPFPYPYFQMERITSYEDVMVPNSAITLRSPCFLLFSVRPDLWEMVVTSAK